jgi:serine/threonine-protein kinase
VDASDPEFRKRFELEAQMTSQLNHPNTVTIHDYGYNQEEDVYYFVMEYIEGKTLRREMKQEGEFDVERALRIAQQIARSVRQAHSVGVIHRDLKPSNVLLTTHDEDRDWVKVVDFGLLKLRKESVEQSSKGVLMGSPRYMSPEQIRRVELDHRSDIYSLGVNFYQMLSGRAPFVGQRAMEILMGHLNNPPPQISAVTERDDIPPEVESYAMTMLSKKSEERPTDMDEVIEVLGRLRKQVRKSIPPMAASSTTQEMDVPEVSANLLRPVEEEISAQSSAPTQWSDTVPASELSQVPLHGASQVLPPEVTGVQEAPSRKGVWIAIASVVILLAGGGTIAYIFASDLGVTKKPRIQTAAVAGEFVEQQGNPEGEEGSEEGEELEAATKTFKIRFETVPEGVDVLEGDAPICTTPCDTDWIVVEGESGPRTFTYVKADHERLERMEEVPAHDITVDVELLPLDKKGEKTSKRPAVKVRPKGPKKLPKSDKKAGDETPPKKMKKGLGLDEEFPE